MVTSGCQSTMLLFRLIIFSRGFIYLTGLSWPDGTYGLPQPLAGCPDRANLRWETGWRRQHLNRKTTRGFTRISNSSHLNATLLKDGESIQRSFCIKTISQSSKTGASWPPGKYCIYKYGDSCPSGMTTGFIHWDDNNNNNKNSHGGTLPDGAYNNDTTIKYCCQNNGHWDKPIDLPVDEPFYLLPYKLAVCQHVKWAVRSLVAESITYHTEEDNNGDQLSGQHVYVKKKKSLITAYYCYYKACRFHFHNYTGNFSSHATSHQYCSWNIAVHHTLIISLTFAEFNIPDCNLNHLDIYEGRSIKGTLLARYCGSNATRALSVNSTGSALFVILKSGGNFDGLVMKYVRLEARYKTRVNSKSCHEDLAVNTNKGNFTSPMFELEDYPTNQTCSWTISVKEEYRVISLSFDYFYLPNCVDNHIIIHDGPNTSSPTLKKLCSEKPAKRGTWKSTGNSLFIVYKSGKRYFNDERRRVGFIASYRVTKRVPVTTTPSSTESLTSVDIRPTTREVRLRHGGVSNERQAGTTNPNHLSIIAATVSVSLLIMLFVVVVILYSRRTISVFVCFPMRSRTPRKESENPIYEQSSGCSSNNPIYSSCPVSVYEEVRTKKTFLPNDGHESRIICNHAAKANDAKESNYETPRI